MIQKRLLLFAGIIVLLAGAVFYSRFTEKKVDFNAEIRPILNQKCMRCHGGVKRNGGLSLLFREEALAENESGLPAIIPGKPGESELISRITHSDPELRMPYEGEPLSEEEVEVFTRWIKQGAKWKPHWAYVAPQRPEVPDIESAEWAYNPIDNFVAQSLEQKELVPSPQAEKNQLIRRLSLDLIGLPPTWEQTEQFIQDTSADAYEDLVDTLLASPHFGERWAAMWLDLARYADSKGYEKDPYRNIWRYRDWVIDAFNADMPYDEFTAKQLAGDLLPNPSQEDLIATGFHRNTMNNTEGGTEDEEYRVAAVIDRLNTTWTVWQGTTMECAQCHSHPYDPFRQSDYYSSYDFFNQSKDEDLDAEYPVLEMLEPKEDSMVHELIQEIQRMSGSTEVNPHSDRISQIKQVLYPRIRIGDCDGWEDVEFYHQKTAQNWARNPNNIPDKSYWIYFKDLDLSKVEEISYRYKSKGDLGKIEVRLDSAKGPLYQELDLPKSPQERWLKGKVAPVSGKRDVYIWMVNKGVNDPEGRFEIMDLYLHTEGEEIDKALVALQDELLNLRWKAQRFPIMREREPKNRRWTREFIRGNWLAPADTVYEPDVPGSLPEFDPEGSRDRKGFAAWVVDPSNPLTSRVMVNRIWEQIFGRGIVETAEDFGTQGAKPSHPKLLDWLALHFQEEQNWSVKGLVKTIVLSSTYRQQSQVNPEQLEKDPENRLFSRGPRVRLTAEQIRDQALVVSGVLSRKMYGPPVMPPQPDKVWQSVYNNERWIPSEGEDRFRRGIYTYWKRTSPYPSMVSFDSPSREFCVSRRIPTNTPLQALVTLNDTVFVEAAKNLAERMLGAGEELDQQLTYGYQRALLKMPTKRTLNTLGQLYHQTLANSENQAFPIQKVRNTETGRERLGAMTVVASALLNLDSFIMKE